MKYFDTHGHINGKFYESEIEPSIKETTNILMPGTTKEDSIRAIELSKKFDNIFAAAGIHPANANDDFFLEELNPNDIIAVGETGIDLYHDTNPSLDVQIKSFERHIDFAKKNNKVLIIHVRDSFKEVKEVLEKHIGLKFIIHSFSGNTDDALDFIKMGGYISFSGVVTFKNAIDIQTAARMIPLDRIICETDSPFLTPIPHRGKPNRPEYVKYIVDHIASIRKENDEVVKQQIFNNSIKLLLG